MTGQPSDHPTQDGIEAGKCTKSRKAYNRNFQHVDHITNHKKKKSENLGHGDECIT